MKFTNGDKKDFLVIGSIALVLAIVTASDAIMDNLLNQQSTVLNGVGVVLLGIVIIAGFRLGRWIVRQLQKLDF